MLKTMMVVGGEAVPPHILERVIAEISTRVDRGEFEGSFKIDLGGEEATCGCESGSCAGDAPAELPCQALSDEQLVDVITGAQPVTHGDRVLHAYADPAVLVGSLTRAAEDFAAGFARVARLSERLLADEI